MEEGELEALRVVGRVWTGSPGQGIPALPNPNPFPRPLAPLDSWRVGAGRRPLCYGPPSLPQQDLLPRNALRLVSH